MFQCSACGSLLPEPYRVISREEGVLEIRRCEICGQDDYCFKPNKILRDPKQCAHSESRISFRPRNVKTGKRFQVVFCGSCGLGLYKESERECH